MLKMGASWLVVVILVTFCFISKSNCYITWIEPRYPLPGERSPPGSPWPLPQTWERNADLLFTLDPSNFVMEANVQACDVIERNLEQYNKYIFGYQQATAHPDAPKLTGLKVTVLSGACETYPKLDSNENYNIEIGNASQNVEIKANTVWGAIRALETFSQLVWVDDAKHYSLNATTIVDSPRFRHRGLLLDTARHFIPKSVLLQNLEAMQINKLNVFHWHLVDDQSFPFESRVYPNLTIQGAYSPKHVYTQEDISEIVEAARLRGIRVIPELDSPGHTRAIGNAFPNLLTPCYGDGVHPFTPNYTKHSAMEVFNPTKQEVYDFVKTILLEMKTLFKDEYAHLGMDEVVYNCWKSNPDIQQFMLNNSYTEYSQLEQYYVRHLMETLADTGYKFIAWQDPIENNVTLPEDTIVQVWKDKELDPDMDYWRNYIVLVANKGYNILLSSCWYLNYISYGQDWKKYYVCDPHDFPGTEAEKALVIGGEATLWAEYLDGTNLLARLWPRASAVAERLWSSASVNDTDSAAFRLDQHRCRMLQRKIPAQPILNGYCGDYEWAL